MIVNGVETAAAPTAVGHFRGAVDMDRYEEAMFDDLAVDEAEGSAERWDEFDEADQMDASDEFDEGDEFDEADEGDEFEEGDQMEASDEFDEGDEFDESEGDEGDDDALDEAMSYALAAEDTDEFFRRIVRGLRRAAPTIGRIARAVGPVASLIPGVGTAVGTAANIVGQLMADEASEEEALDAFAEAAVRNRRVLPIAAGLAARAVLGPRAAALPPAVRRQAVRTIRRATVQLLRQAGPTAVRALPRVARSVRRTAVVRRTPASVRPQVVANTMRRVVRRNPRLRRQLTRPSPIGRQVLQRTRAAVRSGAAPARLAMRGLAGTGRPGVHRPGRLGGYGRPGYRGYGAPDDVYASRGRRITIRGPVSIHITPR
jgi:hypothetical protein